MARSKGRRNEATPPDRPKKSLGGPFFFGELKGMSFAEVTAADTSGDNLARVCHLPPIEFLGEVPLALNPLTNNLTAPPEFLRHELVRDRYFFTLPHRLWAETCHRFGNQVFDPEIAELEVELEAICSNIVTGCGLWRGFVFSYPHLRRAKVPPVSVADVRLTVPQELLNLRLRTSEDRLDGFARIARGYLGWLLLNPQFLDEHDQLLQSHVSLIERQGLADFGLPGPPPGFEQWPAATQLEFRGADERFLAFFCRWRLQGLAAPYLPIPLQPLFAHRLPAVVWQRYLQTGGLFAVPDTFAVPSRDEFRRMLDDALHGSPPDHLAEWMKTVAIDNMGKQSIDRFARIFELQHYWRVLHHRHRDALRRRGNVLKQVMASFFQVEPKTIDKDLAEIRKTLGKTWVERGSGRRFGPF